MKKVVVIGGGTGTFVVLSALKELPDVDLSAIIAVTDSGGSTGRLRDEFGFLPVGDIRQALAALSHKNGQNWTQDLLLYRFSKGSGLEGHNLGNLMLTALQDMTGSTAKAVEIASKIFRLEGHIFPATTKNTQLAVEFDDGQVVVGEHQLDNPAFGGKHIKKAWTKPEASMYNKAAKAIREADMIIVGPGDLYGSLIANLCIGGMRQALADNRGKYVYVLNLMTHYSQTHGMTASEHISEVVRYGGRTPDVVLVNTLKLPDMVLSAYKRNHEFPVVDDVKESGKLRALRRPLASRKIVKLRHGDMVPRSLVRHDEGELKKAFKELLDI